jgi:hypothetical protein
MKINSLPDIIFAYLFLVYIFSFSPFVFLTFLLDVTSISQLALKKDSDIVVILMARGMYHVLCCGI